MAYLTVIIDDILPADDTHIAVNYRWFAIDGLNNAQDSASEEFLIKQNVAQMNQDVIDRAVVLAGLRGITVLSADRKMLVGGMQ